MGKGQIKINKGFSENLTYPVFFGYPVSVCSRPHTSGPDIMWSASCVFVNISKFLYAWKPFFLRNLFNYGPLPSSNIL